LVQRLPKAIGDLEQRAAALRRIGNVEPVEQEPLLRGAAAMGAQQQAIEASSAAVVGLHIDGAQKQMVGLPPEMTARRQGGRSFVVEHFAVDKIDKR
jgi:hypothetical protein